MRDSMLTHAPRTRDRSDCAPLQVDLPLLDGWPREKWILAWVVLIELGTMYARSYLAPPGLN